MERPNILLITTDQQRFDTINALGNPHIYTPHLNWLTDNGITFTRCYSDSPICMPARATIMTGKHGYTLGITGNNSSITPLAEHLTLPALLTRNGYQTRAQGKMHFHPIRSNYGFEHMEIPMDYYREHNRNELTLGIPKAHGVGENEIEPVISTVHETESLTYWTVKRSIDFLETRDDTRPFFLWTSFTKPHPPFDPCYNYWNLYSGKDVPPPVTGDWSQRPEDIPQGFIKPTYVLNNAYRMSEAQLADVKRAYYACITQIDYTLGLLFARMREMNILDNTLIIFTSDHGEILGDHRMAAKCHFLEGSAHIPMIIKPPASYKFDDAKKQQADTAGIMPPSGFNFTGMKCDQLADLSDVMPTILDIAGIEIPSDMDGKSLTDAVKKPAPEKTFYGASTGFLCIMENSYKYQWTNAGGGELLFNLANDPMEKINLVKSPAEAARLAEFRKKLVDFCIKYKLEKVENGKIQHGPAPTGPNDSGSKWPGFHSTVVLTDVLH